MEKLLSENVVKLSGDLEDCDLRPLQKAMIEILQGTQPHAVLDLSEVPTLSAGAMAMLKHASAVLSESGRRLMVISTVQPRVRVLDFALVQLCLEYDSPRKCRGSRTHGRAAIPSDKETVETVAGNKPW